MHITITPTRGDREVFIENLYSARLKQWEAMEYPNGFRVDINSTSPKRDDNDLTFRIRQSWITNTCGENPYSFSIIEDDDYYPLNYIDIVTDKLKKYDVVGFDWTYYYHVGTKRWKKMHHPGRSSLFTTSFRSSCLNGFKWPADDYLFLDIKMWEHFKRSGFSVYWVSEKECRPIGIKHGIGKTGGMGHTRSHTFPNHDPNMGWLRQRVDKQSFEFYKSLEL
jgi:hypothetical protein